MSQQGPILVVSTADRPAFDSALDDAKLFRVVETAWADAARAVEQVQPPTMTKVVSGLEAEGLVARRADHDDGRAVRLEATARGNRLLQEGRQRRIGRLATALQQLTADELDTLARAAAIVERVSATIAVD